MCYYTTSNFSIDQIHQLEYDFVVHWEEEKADDFFVVSGFAHPELPVITSDKRFLKMSWGLIPAWVKDWNAATKLRIQTLNAQSETIDEKPSFRGAVKSSRLCIIPVNGYFEWHHHQNGQKYPHFIYPKNAPYFLVAGIHEDWKNPATAETLSTFTMLTTSANPRLEIIHNSKKRMPVILSSDNAKIWLDNNISFAQKKELMIPYDENLMLDHTIGKLITSRKENPNQPAVVEKVHYPELEI